MSQITATYVDHMGTDQRIIDAARMSFSADDILESKTRTDDQILGLLNFLARGTDSATWADDLLTLEHGCGDAESAAKLLKEIRNRPIHWTPYAHTAITIVCSAPVPIRTQAFKHQVGLVPNEESRRYISTLPTYYIPDFRLTPEGSIKQGSSGEHPCNATLRHEYNQYCKNAIAYYEKLLKLKVCPEQARFVLPQGTIVNWVWTGNLYAFANFYIARSDSHAQKEIQELAEQIDLILRPLFPKAWQALVGQ